MKIEQWKLADIKRYEHNPRLNDAAVDAVAASIQEFGSGNRSSSTRTG